MYIFMYCRCPWTSKQETCARRSRTGSTGAYGIHAKPSPICTGAFYRQTLPHILHLK